MSDPDVAILTAAPRILAVRRTTLTLATIQDAVGVLTAVYEALEEHGLPHLGINVFVYHNAAGQNLLATESGCPMEVGVVVPAAFESRAAVACSATPGGRVARAAHVGPYGLLHQTHKAVRNWCWQNGQKVAGPNWEVYVHGNEDPAALLTDVVYLLK